jgi:dihydrofolate synthase/folylpolyglutamate synthase
LAHRLQLVTPAAKSVVVAGTNGKGSTVRYLEHILQGYGLKVGATASPHLENYNERIRVSGASVSDWEIVRSFEAIEEVRDGIPLTYFEWATLAALDIFNRHGIERAILEVGLGGRLDTCNIIDRNVNVISNIGLDHSDILGSDRETIGSEKAGILKKGIPLIYGDEDPVSSVMNLSQTRDCPVYLVNREFGHTKSSSDIWTCWTNNENEENSFSFKQAPSMPDAAALAVQTAVVLEHHVDQVKSIDLRECSLPGRMEFRSFRHRDWLLDVGHNADAASYISKQLSHLHPGRKVSVLLACMEDKDGHGILDALNVLDHRVTITATWGPRGQRAEELARKLHRKSVRVEPELKFALDYLVGSTGPHDLILVLGSFELVGRVRRMITIGIGR